MDRREALEKAFDEMEAEAAGGDEADLEEGTTEEQTTELPEDEGTGEEAPAEGATDDESAAGKKKETAKTPEGEGKKPADNEYSRAAKAATGKAPVAPGAGATDTKAPLSWRPAVREQWAKLPKEVRDEVQRRELEVQQALSQSSNSRKFAADFGEVVKPFAHLIQAQNSTPLQAVRNLMTTAAGLTIGNHEQKAKIIAEIIQNYGVDLPTLDAVLSKSPNLPAPPAGAGGVPPQFHQMLKPVYDFMGEVKSLRQQRQEQMQQEADAETAQFADKPFFEDVREEMADLMEIAANRGRTMTMQQAYDKAIAMNPEISRILDQRRRAEAAKNGGTRMARARKAASTLSGSPATTGDASKTPTSRREFIEQAWADAESR